MVKNLPPPLDFEAMEQRIKFLLDLEYEGFSQVEIVENLEKLYFPKVFYEYCRRYDLRPHEAVSTIVSDFIIRYYHGNSDYEQGILNRIKEADIPEETRKQILQVILTEKKK